jgi:signal transduction histidine kinase
MDTATTSISAAAARAHALKNSLTVVSIINRLIESELSERSRARLERSQEAVRRMLALIQDDLVAECSPGVRSREFVLARDVIRMVVGRIEDQAEAKGVHIRVEAGSGGVMGVAAALAEALANIVSNAVRATPPGKSVLLATRELPDGSQVWVVQDSGPGISDDIKDRVGTPYLSGSKGGSGLIGRIFISRVMSITYVHSARIG